MSDALGYAPECECECESVLNLGYAPTLTRTPAAPPPGF